MFGVEFQNDDHALLLYFYYFIQVNMFKELSIDEDKEEADEAGELGIEPGPVANILGSSTYRHSKLAHGCDDNWTWSLEGKSHEVRLKGMISLNLMSKKKKIIFFWPKLFGSKNKKKSYLKKFLEVTIIILLCFKGLNEG